MNAYETVWILFPWNMACQLSAISGYEWNDSLVRLKTVLFMECQSRMEADIFANCSFPRIVWYALAPHAFPEIMQLGKLYICTYPWTKAFFCRGGALLYSADQASNVYCYSSSLAGSNNYENDFLAIKSFKGLLCAKASLQTVFRCDLWAACINLSWKTAQEGTLCTAQPPLCEAFSS